MPKYPKIVVDESINSPINMMNMLTVERYYDFVHHTHKMSDIIKDTADGDGNNDNSNPTVATNGKSAYEIWLSLGNTGSENDFINSLKGENGEDGIDGISPTVSLSRTLEDDGVIITVTDINGEKSITVYDGIDNGGGTGGNITNPGTGISIYDNYSALPSNVEKDTIVYVENEYNDGIHVYTDGLYFADATNSSYKEITAIADWVTTINKPFNDINPQYFAIDPDSNLILSDTVFDEITVQINAINSELNRKASINDEVSSGSTITWSVDQIKTELDKKAEANTNHNHGNLNDVLNKLAVDQSGNLQFDAKTIMTKNEYDIDSDGKVEHAKTADTINGLLATITELNYLLGARSSIQSQIDALQSGVDFKGEYSNFASMQSNITTPKKGDWVYIAVDETQNNQNNTQYVYNGDMWIYGGGRNTVNEASNTVKGVVQLAGDLSGSASSPQLAEIIEPQNIGYIKSISVDKKGRITNITEDNTLAQRIADLESRPQIYISQTQPTNLKDGDIWIEG